MDFTRVCFTAPLFRPIMPVPHAMLVYSSGNTDSAENLSVYEDLRATYEAMRLWVHGDTQLPGSDLRTAFFCGYFGLFHLSECLRAAPVFAFS